jgi:hypothetical protein
MASEASVADGWVEWRAEGGPAQESRRFAWPEGALLAHGQRLMARARGTAPGTRYAYRSIELGSGQSIDIDVSIGAVEQVALPAGNVEAVTIRQRARSTSGVQEAELWLDPRRSTCCGCACRSWA